MNRARRIASRFDAAATTYEAATPVQRRIAQALAEEILAEPLPAAPRVLELGCGPGCLTASLAPALQPALWVAGDLAPGMLAGLGRRLPHPRVRPVLMDAEAPPLLSAFDMVCSSLTLQWLADPAAALARWRGLVRPGGLLAVSTLLQGSFAEWRAALADVGVPEPAPAFIALADLRAATPGARIRPVTLTETHDSALAFLRTSRRAGVDAGLGRSLDAGTMRRAARAFEATGARITYQAALVVVRV